MYIYFEYGLPNSKVTSVIQDAKGFIWIATEGGIVRFDGVDFTSFDNTDAEEKRYGGSTNILFEDSRGTFWVGTSQGLQVFDQKLNTFRKFDVKDPEVPGSNLYIHHILEVPEENGRSLILASASQHGIYIIDADSHLLDNEGRAALKSIPGLEASCKMFLDSKGRIWIAQEFGGISVVDKKDFKQVDIDWSLESASIKNDALASSFIEDRETGNIIIGTSNHGILIFESSKMTVRQAKGDRSGSCKAMSILLDSRYRRTGYYILGTDGGGLYCMLSDGKTVCYSANNSNLPDNSIMGLTPSAPLNSPTRKG